MALVHLPIAIIETLIFSCVLYPMVGLSLVFKQWAFFYLQLSSWSDRDGVILPCHRSCFADDGSGAVIPGPFIAVMILFAGFLISPEKMGGLKFMYWTSILAYCLRWLCQMNFCPASTKCWYPTIPWVRQLSWRTIRNTTPLRWWSFALKGW